MILRHLHQVPFYRLPRRVGSARGLYEIIYTAYAMRSTTPLFGAAAFVPYCEPNAFTKVYLKAQFEFSEAVYTDTALISTCVRSQAHGDIASWGGEAACKCSSGAAILRAAISPQKMNFSWQKLAVSNICETCQVWYYTYRRSGPVHLQALHCRTLVYRTGDSRTHGRHPRFLSVPRHHPPAWNRSWKTEHVLSVP